MRGQIGIEKRLAIVTVGQDQHHDCDGQDRAKMEQGLYHHTYELDFLMRADFNFQTKNFITDGRRGFPRRSNNTFHTQMGYIFNTQKLPKDPR